MENHQGQTAALQGAVSRLQLTILEPAGAVFTPQLLAEECQRNLRSGVLTRLAAMLPAGATAFVMHISRR